MTPVQVATSETPITLTEASAVFPLKNGKRTSLYTIKRWVIQGYRGIRLEGWKVGNTWFTTRAAIARFQEACTARAMGPRIQANPDVRADAAAARAILRSRGFYDRGRRNGCEAN